MDNKPKNFLRIAIALLLAATGIVALVGAISLVDTSSRFHEFPTSSQIALVLGIAVLVGATGAYVWSVYWVLSGRRTLTPLDSINISFLNRLSVNCLFAVFLAWGVIHVLFTLHDWVTYLWTEGGIPGFLISKGWSSISALFVYDTLRFCLVSFVAVWPVTYLKPQKPVLYSLAIMIAMIILLQYWRHLDDWATLPHRVRWTPWLVLIHVLSIPAMYQVHIYLKATYNKSFNTDTGGAGAG